MVQNAVLESVPAAASRSTLWRLVALLFATFAMAALGQLVVVVLVPGMKQTLRIDDTQISLLNGAGFALPHAAAILVCGWLADRWNRRNLLLIGLVGWSLALIAGGLAQTFAHMLAARVALGAFQAVLIPAMTSMVADEAPPEVRGRALAVVMSGGTIGAAASLFIGGALLQLFSARPPVHLLGLVLAPWQSVLALFGLPGLLLAPLLLTIREPARHMGAGGASFRLGKHLKENAAVFILVLATCACFLMASYAQASWTAVVELRNLHMKPAVAGVTLGVIALAGGVLSATLGGYLNDRAGRRDPDAGRLKLLSLLLALSAASSTLLLALAYPPVVISSFLFAAILGTMTASIAATLLSELVPSEGRGQVMALFGFITILGAMGVAPTLVALVTDHVLKDENRLPLSIVLVAAPGFILAMTLALAAVPGARALRRRVRAIPGEA